MGASAAMVFSGEHPPGGWGGGAWGCGARSGSAPGERGSLGGAGSPVMGPVPGWMGRPSGLAAGAAPGMDPLPSPSSIRATGGAAEGVCAGDVTAERAGGAPAPRDCGGAAVPRGGPIPARRRDPFPPPG